jgi:hypothetical protein
MRNLLIVAAKFGCGRSLSRRGKSDHDLATPVRAHGRTMEIHLFQIAPTKPSLGTGSRTQANKSKHRELMINH